MASDLEPGMTVPTILRLKIDRFRGLKAVDWRPSAGLNLILGGGDVGKTTILDAVALLLSPVNPANLPDTDFYGRAFDEGFSIEAVLSLPATIGIHSQLKLAWPWDWNGAEAIAPSLEGDAPADSKPVYRVRVRGTEDLELYYEILQPDGSADHFPVALRRQIGLVRLGGDDRNDRDLRLVQGSALDRLLSDKGLRSRMASTLADHAIKDELADDAKASLADLDKAFGVRSLPTGLDLQITGGQGASIASMVGLTAQRGTMTLPLASWGAGTRRLAALAIAEQNQGETPITVVDEVERGLEPYRQRVLMEKLQEMPTQAFVTTHSPATISAAAKATLWYVDHAGQIGEIKGKVTEQHRARDPELFLSRIAIVAEGATECGADQALIGRALGGALAPHGVHVCDGGGHEFTLGLLQALAKSRLRFGGFVDEEGKHADSWKALEVGLGSLLFRWEKGCIEEEIVAAIADDKLEELVIDPTGEKTGTRFWTLAMRLGIDAKDMASIRDAAGDGLKALILEAALGKVPDGKESEKKAYRSQSQSWFKTVAGGQELIDKMFGLGLWPTFKPRLLPFCNAVRGAVGLEGLSDLGA
jgi:putative ATP-dependent endonuclease of OLD family